MPNSSEPKYIKRTQKDYSLPFKLQIVQEVEDGETGVKEAQRKYGIQGSRTISTWLKKYGNYDWENLTPSNVPKTQDHKILELELKVKLLKKKIAFLEKQIETSDKKVIIFDMMVDIAKKELKSK